MSCPVCNYEMFAAGMAAGVVLLALVLGAVTLVHDCWFKPEREPKKNPETDKGSST